MKILNKLVILSLIVFALSLCFMFYTYSRLTGSSSGGKIMPENKDSAHIVKTENNVSPPVGKDSVQKRYLLKLKGDIICAYVQEGDSMKLWNSTKKPLSLSSEDIARLERGLYTSSFEELCLFFESFVS